MNKKDLGYQLQINSNLFRSAGWCAILFLVVTACRKSETAQPTFTTGVSVYMAGTADGHAVYWKNGVKVDLDSSANAYSIVLAGNDILLSGIENRGGNILAVYWKNGVKKLLTTTGIAHAFGLYVSGNDVYCAGDIFGASPIVHPVYWKNDSAVDLAPGSKGVANGIAFQGADMYVIGHVFNDFDTAVVWKNGTEREYGIQGTALSNVQVLGSDVYLTGKFGTGASYYKNETYHSLSAKASAAAVAIAGSDTYVCGLVTDSKGQDNAAYWKNGVQVILTDKYATSFASGIAIAGSDVYVVGTIYESFKYIPVYWKNGSMVKLAASGEATGICVGN